MQVVFALAQADVFHRDVEFFADGEDDAAFGRAVEFRQDHAGEGDDFSESFRLAHRILSRRRVQHQECLMRRVRDDFFNHAADFFELFHEIHFRLETPRRVDEYDIRAACDRCRYRIESDRCRVRPFRVLHDVGARALRPDGQLLGSCRAERIRRRQENLLSFLLPAARHFSNRRRLAHTIYAHDQNHFRMMQLFFRRLIPQHFGHDFFHIRHDFFCIGNPPLRHAAANLAHEIIRRPHAEITRQKHRLQIVQEIVVDFRVADHDRFNVFNEARFRLAQTFFDFVEKSHLSAPFSYST